MTPTAFHPWQQGPSELIVYALEHMHKGGDFNQRIAFLLLDVGVETLLKTFLTLPEDISGVKTPYHKRAESAKGNFHELVRATKEAAPDKVKDIDLTHVQFYHDVRNKLYHQGNGITISSELLNGYATLSVELLRELLELDVTDILKKPEIEAGQKAVREKLESKLSKKIQEVHTKIAELENMAELAIERIEPQLLLPSIIRTFETEPIQVYLGKLEGEITKTQGLSGHHYLARLYPQYAQQPDIHTDENGDSIAHFPPIEEVIQEGDSLLLKLDDFIKIIDAWIKNAI